MTGRLFDFRARRFFTKEYSPRNKLTTDSMVIKFTRNEEIVPAKANHAMRTFVGYPKEFIHKGQSGKHAISAMKRSKLKRRARISGKVYRGAALEDGGWDPAWDIPRFRMLPMKPSKGTKRERTVRKRVGKIDKAMEGMAQLVFDYRSESDNGQSMGTFQTQVLGNPMFKKLAAEEIEAEKVARKAAQRKARQGK